MKKSEKKKLREKKIVEIKDLIYQNNLEILKFKSPEFNTGKNIRKIKILKKNRKLLLQLLNENL